MVYFSLTQKFHAGRMVSSHIAATPSRIHVATVVESRVEENA